MRVSEKMGKTLFPWHKCFILCLRLLINSDINQHYCLNLMHQTFRLHISLTFLHVPIFLRIFFFFFQRSTHFPFSLPVLSYFHIYCACNSAYSDNISFSIHFRQLHCITSSLITLFLFSPSLVAKKILYFHQFNYVPWDSCF